MSQGLSYHLKRKKKCPWIIDNVKKYTFSSQMGEKRTPNQTKCVKMWKFIENKWIFDLPATTSEKMTKIFFNILTITNDWSYDVLWLSNDKQWWFYSVSFNTMVSTSACFDLFHVTYSITAVSPFETSEMSNGSQQLHTVRWINWQITKMWLI